MTLIFGPAGDPLFHLNCTIFSFRGGGRDGSRPLATYETLTEERKQEIKTEKNRRQRHAKIERSRAAREALWNETRTGLDNLSLGSNFSESPGDQGQMPGSMRL